MKLNYLITCLLIAITFQAKSQIYIEGRSTYRPDLYKTPFSFSLAYGQVVWIDGMQEKLIGYSKARKSVRTNGEQELMNETLMFAFQPVFGVEHNISNKFTMKYRASFGAMYSGINFRKDIYKFSESKFAQFSAWGSLNLAQNPNARVYFEWMFGPEVLYVKKDLTVRDYVEQDGDTPTKYLIDVKSTQVAVTTGLCLNFIVTNHLSLFSEGVVGLSLPDKGFKSTFSNIGLKYTL